MSGRSRYAYTSVSLTAPLLSVLTISHNRLKGHAQKIELVTCYAYNGKKYFNNTICPNSYTCCNAEAVCLSNRLCLNKGYANNVFVRGPCALDGWSKLCAQVCLYNETTGIFPRVTVCADGSVCCDNEPQCCQDGTGTFLDDEGRPVSTSTGAALTSYVPTTDTSGNMVRITKAPSSSLSSSAITNSGSINSCLAESSGEKGTSSVGLGLGVGLGISLGIALIGAFFFCSLRRRRYFTLKEGTRGEDQVELQGSYGSRNGRLLAGAAAMYHSAATQKRLLLEETQQSQFQDARNNHNDVRPGSSGKPPQEQQIQGRAEMHTDERLTELSGKPPAELPGS